MTDIKLSIKDIGWVIIEYKDGRKERLELDDDLVVDVGLNYYQQRIYDNALAKMAYGAVGTGTYSPVRSDTALQSEVIRKSFSVATNPSTGKLHLEFVLDFAEGNGYSFTEIGIFNAASGGIMLLRKLFASACTKTSDKKVTFVVESTIATA